MTKLAACLACQLLALGAVAPSAAEDTRQATDDALRREVAALRQALEQVQDTNRRLTGEISALAARLERVAASAPATGGAPQPTAATPAAAPGSGGGGQVPSRLPELPERAITAGDLPGSIVIPDTSIAFKLGGQVRTTLIHTLGPLGTDDRFIASSIPVGETPTGEISRTTYTAAPSRLNLDLRSPWREGRLRAFLEGDFAGSSDVVRLRHAFLQTDRWLFGQTWSTFSDPEVQPIDIDFEGENALSRFRQAQVRYTRATSARVELALALENPAPDLTGAQGVNVVPDIVGRLRWHPDPSARSRPQHLQAAVLFRSLRGDPLDITGPTESTEAFGAGLSGVFTPRWKAEDRLKLAAYAGRGIGRYLTDLAAAGGQDAVFDAGAGELRALPVASWYVAYEHQWHPAFLSSFTYGEVYVDNLDVQPASALRSTRRVTANIVWNPIAHSDLVLEYLAGERINKNRQRGTSNQVQAGWRFRF